MRNFSNEPVYIDKYNGYKLLAHLRKRGVSVKFLTNDEEEWLIDKVKYREKNNLILLDEGIIAKDYDIWIKYYKEKGFIEVI